VRTAAIKLGARPQIASSIIITSHQHVVEAKPVVGELKGQAKDCRGVSLSPEFWNDDVPDVTA